MKLINIPIFCDNSIESLNSVTKLLLPNHQKIFRILVQVILSISRQNKHSFGIAVNFSGMLQRLAIAIITRTTVLHMEKVYQMKSFENELSNLQIERSVKEKLHFWVVGKSLKQIFHVFDRSIQAVVYSHSEHFLDFLNSVEKSLRFDFQLDKTLFFSVRQLDKQSIDLPSDDDLRWGGLGRGAIPDCV